jgi:hypothetical protein
MWLKKSEFHTQYKVKSKMKTSLQTVEIIMPTATLDLTGFELVPILPSSYDLEAEENVHLKKANGAVVSWSSDGTVSEQRGKITYVWHPRPTMKDALSLEQEGSVVIFAKDSVQSRWEGINYYWSNPVYDAEPVVGERVYFCPECEAEMPKDDLCEKCKDAIYRDYYRFGY